MSEHKVSFEIAADRSIEISTGKMANLAAGSCLVRQGDTVVLVAASTGPARDGADFFPLQIDYREKYCSAGKFPGGYIKREGRPTEKEILTCRVTDRPIRSMFPKGFFDEVQIQSITLSTDGKNDPDMLCMIGASAALSVSSLPFMGPIGALRVGMVDGQFVANPTLEEQKQSTLELIYAGVPGKVIMIEGECDELTEEQLHEAMLFADSIVKIQVEAQQKLVAEAGKPKSEPNLKLVPAEIDAAIAEYCTGMEEACKVAGKAERGLALDKVAEGMNEALAEKFPEQADLDFYLKIGFDNLVKKTVRKAILEKQFRPDGRGIEDLRPLSAEVGLLPVVHGTGLFSRGETQALVIATLGNEKASQEYDDPSAEPYAKRFYLHYNFPNFSVGEPGRIMGPGRREIGHGNLAERSVSKVIPKDYPYVIRCVSEVMASNGSTSMASVCGATLSLMDAGVPIKAPVAGISCGLVTGDNGEELLLTDILGAEDHFGDMDFKVCGTREGITGFQLDLKLPGISLDLLCQGMERNKVARMKILDTIEECIAAPREELNPNAPRIETIKINPEKIGALIGPGGKNIRAITAETESDINVEEDGTVKIMAADKEHMDEALRRVGELTAEVEVGNVYRGLVKGVRDFGAFVEILPGQEGLLHISEMANYRVRAAEDICQEGDYVTVKVLDVDQSGKIRLSRRAALEEMED